MSKILRNIQLLYIGNEPEMLHSLPIPSKHRFTARDIETAQNLLYDLFPDVVILELIQEIKETLLFLEYLQHQTGRSHVIYYADSFDDALLHTLSEYKFVHPLIRDSKHLILSNLLERYGEDHYHTLTGLPGCERLSFGLHDGEKRLLIMLQIDHMIHYNNVHGALFTEELTMQIATLLETLLPQDCSLFHTENDVFAILVENSDIDRARDIARILDIVTNESPFEVDSITLYVNFTIGIAKGAEPDLITTAMMALTEASKAGSRQFTIDDDHHQHSEASYHHLGWLDRFKHALNNDQIYPLFQPIINNHTGEVEKYEALARLQVADQIHFPNQFLQAAQVSGLMPNLTYTIVNKSLKMMQDNHYEVSINIGDEDLASDTFVDYLLNRTKHYNIDPSRIVIELLESISINESLTIFDALKELKSKGFKIAIDDFGTEKSNFSRLVDMEIDYLKIDGKFIKDLDTNPKSQKITEAIATLAKNLGIASIAEFVHSESIYRYIQEYGIDYSQGYYFGEPVTKF